MRRKKTENPVPVQYRNTPPHIGPLNSRYWTTIIFMHVRVGNTLYGGRQTDTLIGSFIKTVAMLDCTKNNISAAIFSKSYPTLHIFHKCTFGHPDQFHKSPRNVMIYRENRYILTSCNDNLQEMYTDMHGSYE